MRTIQRLRKQLKTDHKKDAEDCIKIYNCIKEINGDGRVWSSQWAVFVDVKIDGFHSDDRIYKPSKIGRVLLKAIE